MPIFQGSARHPVTEIAIHCAAVRPDFMGNQTLAAKVAEVKRWHVQDRGWRDIGYHLVIDRDGQSAPGRALTVIGAGIEGHNRGVIHICLWGGHGGGAEDRFDQHYTPAQAKALVGQITRLRGLIGGPVKISGHNEYAAKACPCFFVPAWARQVGLIR